MYLLPLREHNRYAESAAFVREYICCLCESVSVHKLTCWHVRTLPEDHEGSLPGDCCESLIVALGHGGTIQIVSIILQGTVSMSCKQIAHTNATSEASSINKG